MSKVELIDYITKNYFSLDYDLEDLKKELECKTNEECIEVIGNELCDRGVCERI